MKRIPNSITLARIVLSILILFSSPYSTYFIVLYCICGLSDSLDGYIARKFSLESEFGAKLDSMADLIFMMAVLIKLLPSMIAMIPLFIKIWIVVIALIRIISLFIVRYKHHSFAVLHTYLNKLSGIILFLFPLLHRVIDVVMLSGIICIIASLAALEEIIIHLTTEELKRDYKGVCFERLHRRRPKID